MHVQYLLFCYYKNNIKVYDLCHFHVLYKSWLINTCMHNICYSAATKIISKFMILVKMSFSSFVEFK